MEKYDEIINAINMINKQDYNKTDNVLKDLMRFIFTSFGKFNEGAFEFIYEYAIKDSLMNFYNFAKENNLPLVRIPYTEKDNINLEMLFGEKFLIK